MRFQVPSTVRSAAQRSGILELCEDLFGWIEIWTVRRQEKELFACGTDRAPHGLSLVASEIVDDDNVARSECRHKYLFDISQEDPLIGPSITQGASMRSAQRSDEGQRAPTAIRSLRYQTLSSWRTAMLTRHIGLGPGLVDDVQASQISLPLILFPLRPTSGDVGTILLAGAQAFLKLMPSCSKKCHTA
jgi:hypothetical protein